MTPSLRTPADTARTRYRPGGVAGAEARFGPKPGVQEGVCGKR